MKSDCEPLKCKCPYGFLKDEFGCDVCRCYDPCRESATGKVQENLMKLIILQFFQDEIMF